jgi:hypothetical protein
MCVGCILQSKQAQDWDFINTIKEAGIKVGPDCGPGRIRSDQVGLGRTKSD